MNFLSKNTRFYRKSIFKTLKIQKVRIIINIISVSFILSPEKTAKKMERKFFFLFKKYGGLVYFLLLLFYHLYFPLVLANSSIYF